MLSHEENELLRRYWIPAVLSADLEADGAPRRAEHLGASDIAVIRMRRLMFESVHQFTTRGAPPLGLREPFDHRTLHAEEKTIPLGVNPLHHEEIPC